MTTTMGAAWGNLVLSRDGDLIQIAPVDGQAENELATAAIPVMGGLIFVDVTQPSRPPRALIADPFWARTWVRAVYGPAILPALDAWEAGDADSPASVDATYDYLSEATIKLAIGFWLHRWWPSGALTVPEIDTRLLELEIATTAVQAEALVLDLEPYARLLAPHVNLARDIVEDLRTHGTGDVAERDLGTFTEALRAIVELLPSTTPGYSACADIVEQFNREESAATTTEPIDWSTVVGTMWNALEAAIPQRELALATKGGFRGARRKGSFGTFSVDQAQVPPQTVTAREANGSWTIDATTVRISVDAAPGYDTERPAVLIAHVGEEPVLLQYDAPSHAFSGTATLADPEVPTISIYSPAYAQTPQPNTAAADAQAQRESIILGRSRLATGFGGHFVAERMAHGRGA